MFQSIKSIAVSAGRNYRIAIKRIPIVEIAIPRIIMLPEIHSNVITCIS
ncbi:MAG: hypothetical protein QW707_07250 [Candidatus Bathyarchaeia archaeon]